MHFLRHSTVDSQKTKTDWKNDAADVLEMPNQYAKNTEYQISKRS